MSIISSDDEILIPFEHLKTVIAECTDHIRGLVKTSSHLHNNHDYAKSIMISIIAYEEFNKLLVFTDNERRFTKGITRRELRDLTFHKYKLTKLVDIESSRQHHFRESIGKLMTKEEEDNFRKSIERLKNSFRTLNFIKQCIMYYDFRIDRTLTFEKQVQYDNLDHFSLYLLELLAYAINVEMLIHNFGDTNGKIVAKKEQFENTKLWKNIEFYHNRFNSSEYSITIKKFWNTIYEFESLHTYLKKENLLV